MLSISPVLADLGSDSFYFCRLGLHASNEGFTGNSIRTSKYNIVTFLPFFFYYMFSRVAYLYFLTQVCNSPSPKHLSHRRPELCLPVKISVVKLYARAG